VPSFYRAIVTPTDTSPANQERAREERAAPPKEERAAPPKEERAAPPRVAREALTSAMDTLTTTMVQESRASPREARHQLRDPRADTTIKQCDPSLSLSVALVLFLFE
jgi:hypothetical protein